jgi:hypothetical protein
MDTFTLGIMIFVGIVLVLVFFANHNADKFATVVAIERTLQGGAFIKGMLKKNKKK